MRSFHFLFLTTLPFLAACGSESDPLPLLHEVSAEDGDPRWAALLKPSSVKVDARGTVYVSDNGDRTIKVHDRSGRILATLGGAGSGPGEFENIQDFAVDGNELLVIDARLRRLTRMGADGSDLGLVEGYEGEAALSTVGGGTIILANHPAWDLPGPDAAAYLMRVLEEGGSIHILGERAVTGNPFVDHVVNFVLPAGTADGRYVWMARLNDPEVEVYALEGGARRVVRRDLPYAWRRIPSDFTPTAEDMSNRRDFRAPFDPVSLGIATDAAGRAYILTVLAALEKGEREPAVVGVDVIDPETLRIDRFRVPGRATQIGVSPDGARIYLLDAPTATVRVYELPTAALEPLT